MNKFDPAKKLVAVARLIGGDPAQLVPRLIRFAPLITDDKSAAEADARDRKLVEAIRAMEQLIALEAKVYEGVEQQFGFAAPTIFDEASACLSELIDYIGPSPPRGGGPTPKSGRAICAGVCAKLWGEVHGKAQPYSIDLWAACEEYWKACGNPGVGPGQGTKLWQNYLVEARADELSHP